MNPDTLKKNMLWNAAGNIIYLMSQWVMTVLVTVLGGLTDAGILSVAMSVSATFQTLALFGIRNFQVSDTQRKYTDSTYTGFRTLTCAGALLICMVFSLISGYLGGQLLAIFLFMMFRLAETYSDVLHGIAQKNDRLDIAGKSFSIKGIGLLVCFLAGFYLSKDLNVGLLLMTLFSCASTLLYDFPAVRKLSEFRLLDPLSRCGKLALETLPLCVYLFLASAISTVPRLILEMQCGKEVLGAYASIFAPALLLQSATGYLYNPFATQFAEWNRQKDRRAFCNLLLKLVLVILGISAVILLAAQFLGEFALVLVFGEQIREYVYLLQPILIVNILISYFGLLSMVVIVLRNFRWLLAGYAAGFLTVLFLTGPAIRLWGVNGTSYSLIAAAVMTSLILAIGILRSDLLIRKN